MTNTSYIAITSEAHLDRIRRDFHIRYSRELTIPPATIIRLLKEQHDLPSANPEAFLDKLEQAQNNYDLACDQAKVELSPYTEGEQITPQHIERTYTRASTAELSLRAMVFLTAYASFCDSFETSADIESEDQLTFALQFLAETDIAPADIATFEHMIRELWANNT